MISFFLIITLSFHIKRTWWLKKFPSMKSTVHWSTQHIKTISVIAMIYCLLEIISTLLLLFSFLPNLIQITQIFNIISLVSTLFFSYFLFLISLPYAYIGTKEVFRNFKSITTFLNASNIWSLNNTKFIEIMLLISFIGKFFL